MAKEKSAKAQPVPVLEVTFVCKFCGEAKPLSELTLQTRFFPVLTACRACEKALQSLKIEDLPEESPENAAEEAVAESGDEKA
jgi:transcription elongation factor Elf1